MSVYLDLKRSPSCILAVTDIKDASIVWVDAKVRGVGWEGRLDEVGLVVGETTRLQSVATLGALGVSY